MDTLVERSLDVYSREEVAALLSLYGVLVIRRPWIVSYSAGARVHGEQAFGVHRLTRLPHYPPIGLSLRALYPADFKSFILRRVGCIDDLLFANRECRIST
jgi:hypothetical protein